MYQSRLLEDIVTQEGRQSLKPLQSEAISLFRELSTKLLLLHGHKEAEAIPDMAFIVDFMERLLVVLSSDQNDTFAHAFEDLTDLINFLMEQFFPELATLIFKVGMFPTASVLAYTAKFLELYMLLALKAIKACFPFNIRAIDTILSADKTNYYSSNNVRVDANYAPFGDQLCEDQGFNEWADGLKEGDEVDAIKFWQADTKMIWSRGIVTDVKQYNVYVNYHGESQSQVKEKFLKKAPFQINRLGSRSVDFGWRENLSKGDTFDFFMGKKGWLLFTIEEVIKQWDNKEIFIFVKGKYQAGPTTPRPAAGEDDSPVTVTVNVHDPTLRMPGTYSKLRYVPQQYCNDEIYEVADPSLVAVTRSRGDTDLSTPLVNSKYYLRFVNLFVMEGGFEVMKSILNIKDTVCSAQLVGHFMNIMSNTSPFLLNRCIQKEGIVFAEYAFRYVLEGPTDNLRNLSKEIVECIYKGFEQLSKRIYSQEKAKEKSEDFLLRVASIFMSTDNLERKLHGVTILGDIYRKIKAKEFEKVTKKDLADLIEKDGLMEQIIKGHTQLITKSTDLFKLMFEEGKMNEKTLQFLWTTMRKADLDTRNALSAMLNEAFFDFSYFQSAYFLNRLADIEPKQATLDDVELAYKLANFVKYKPEDTKENVSSLAVGVRLTLG